MPIRRRTLALLAGGAAGAAAASWLGAPAIAARRGADVLPEMTEGPFYPPADYRARSLDRDADLTRTGTHAPAEGEHLDLVSRVLDATGRRIDACTVEIWQCDVYRSYRHPRGAGERVDEGFQGYGTSRSDAQGVVRFRTIRPVAYPGRTPHIHVKLRHPSFGELTSQLFVAGDPGNSGDFLWNRLGAAERAAVSMALRPSTVAGVRWQVERDLVVPG